jgi:uncharacterized protein (TIGR03083 family)
MKDLPYIDFVRDEGRGLALASRRDLEARVPSCPDWNVKELVEHTGTVHRHIAERLRGYDGDKPPQIVEAPSDDAGLFEWYDSGLDALVNLLESIPADASRPTWYQPDQTAGFWRRRMALENAVHRWDAENATGTAGAIDPELGGDGVDEFLDIHVPEWSDPYKGMSGTVHMHRTDGEGEWVVALNDGEIPEVRHAHEKSAAAVRGSGSDLMLLVWRRRSPEDLEVLGDQRLVKALWDYWGPAGE